MPATPDGAVAGCGGALGCGGPSLTCAFCSCRQTRPCDQCHIRCCLRRDVDRWLLDVGGDIELDDTPWVHVPTPRVPAFVPVLGGVVSPLPRWPIWGVRAQAFLSKDGGAVQKRWLSGRTPQEIIGAPPDAAVALTLVGTDPLIERLWTMQWAGDLWAAIARAGFDLVIGPNYSVYGDHPRFEHRLNIKRSILAAYRMRLLGVPAVPSVYVWWKEDVDALGRWARAVELDAVAVNCQTFRSRREWDRAWTMLLLMKEALPGNVRWFFPGVSTRDRIAALRTFFPGCVIMSLWPYQLAVHGRRITPGGYVQRHLAQAAELLDENVRQFDALCRVEPD